MESRGFGVIRLHHTAGEVTAKFHKKWCSRTRYILPTVPWHSSLHRYAGLQELYEEIIEVREMLEQTNTEHERLVLGNLKQLQDRHGWVCGNSSLSVFSEMHRGRVPEWTMVGQRL